MTIVDVDAFATLTACRDSDLDLLPPKFNRVVSKNCQLFPVSFIATAQSVHIVVTRSV